MILLQQTAAAAAVLSAVLAMAVVIYYGLSFCYAAVAMATVSLAETADVTAVLTAACGSCSFCAAAEIMAAN